MAQKQWIPLEANPAVINDYISALGFPIELYHFVDVLSCDDWALDMIEKPVLGFLLLYNSSPKAKQALRLRQEKPFEVSQNIYYMKQTISNACGTIGIMHILANSVYAFNIPLKENSFLEGFLSRSLEMTPDDRGKLLENGENSEVIEKAHEEAANSGQSRVPESNEKISLHFNAIVPVDGGIYELDGRAGRPIFHGNFENFEKDACQKVILNEFFLVDPTDHHFSILALTPNSYNI